MVASSPGYTRYPTAALAAAAVTFGLFFTMQSLIKSQRATIDDNKKSWQLDFVRLKRDEALNRKERKKPQKLERPDPPPQSAPPADNTPAEMAVDIPLFDAGLGLGDGPGLGGGADSDVVPMVRVNPQYPSRAAARGVEGWVHLRFTVTPQGTTSEIQVVEADPRGYFETAAKAAVKRYKYKPKVDGGVAVERPGVEVMLTFELEK